MVVHLRRFILIALVICTSIAPALAADKPLPADMKAVLQTDLEGFNTNNFGLSNSQYAPSVVIIDETPPYRWEGPNATASYWANFRKLAKAIKLTSFHFSFQKPAYWELSGGRAYIVSPTLYTGVAGGQRFTETGVETYLLVKIGHAWKCAGWAYSKLSAY